MKRVIRIGLFVPAAMLPGCMLGGTWRVAEVKPQPPGGYPISMITFDENAMTYAATTSRETETLTSEGGYDWDGFKLTLRPKEKPERIYQGYLFWGKLHLEHMQSGTGYEATLVRDEAD